MAKFSVSKKGLLALAIGAALPLSQAYAFTAPKYHPGHYMQVTLGGGSFKNFATIANNPNFQGVVKKYTWRSLEPQLGVLDFSQITTDLNYLKSINKRLIIRFKDFDSSGPMVPDYVSDPTHVRFAGGYYKSAASNNNYVAKRWIPKVAYREGQVLKALGRVFDQDPYVEAVVLEEAATGIPKTEWTVSGYSPLAQRDGVISIDNAAKTGFPNTVVVQLINYLTGGPQYLADIAANAQRLGMGIGAADVYVGGDSPNVSGSYYVPAYQYFPQYTGQIPLAGNVESVCYDQDLGGGTTATAAQLMNYAVSYLHTNYLFWSLIQPSFDSEVIPTAAAHPTF